MKKITSLILAVLMLAALFAGCSAPSEPETVEPTGTDSASQADTENSDEVVELTFFGFKTANQAEALETIVANFNAENPNIQVTYEGITMPGGYTDVLSSRLASGQGDDVFMVNANDAVHFAGTGYCEDLAPLGIDDQMIISMAEPDGYIPAIAMSAPTIGLYVNKGVLEEAGITEVPTTYDDFMAACEAVKAIGKMPIVGGSKEGTGAASFTVTKSFADMYFGDGDIVEQIGLLDSGEVSMGETMTPGLEWTKEIADKGYIDAEASIVQSQLTDALPEFAKGETAFYVMGSWAINSIRESCPDFDLAFTGFPVDNTSGPVLLTTLDCRIAVNSEGENKEAAMLFAEYILRVENVDMFCTNDSNGSNYKDASPELDPVIEESMYIVKNGKTVPWTDTTFKNYSLWNLMLQNAPKIFAGESVEQVADAIDNSVMMAIELQ